MQKVHLAIFSTLIVLKAALPSSVLAQGNAGEGPATNIEGVSILTSFTMRNDVFAFKENDQPEIDSVNANLTLNLGVGYTWSHGLHLGWIGLRHTESTRMSDETGNEVASRATTQGFGPRIGYETSFGLSLYLSYLMQTKTKIIDTVSDGITENEIESSISDSSGVLAELGYGIKLNRFVAFGPQLTFMRRSYRSITATDGTLEQESRGVFQRTTIQPQFAFWLKF